MSTSPPVPTLPAAKIGRRPIISPMLTGLRSSSLSSWSSGRTTRSSRLLGESPAANSSPSISRITDVGREAITRSGGMPYHSAAAGRMKCTPLPEQIQTEKSRDRRNAISSFIGANVVSPRGTSNTGCRAVRMKSRASASSFSSGTPPSAANDRSAKNFLPSRRTKSRSPVSSVVNGSSWASSGRRSTSAFTRSIRNMPWAIGFSQTSVPSLSNTATRSAVGTKSLLPGVVTAATNSRIARFVGPSFQLGSGSVAVAGAAGRSIGAGIGVDPNHTAAPSSPSAIKGTATADANDVGAGWAGCRASP